MIGVRLCDHQMVEMSVYSKGLFFFPVFADLQGVSLAYWPTGQIGLLIQPLPKQVNSFLSLDPH